MHMHLLKINLTFDLITLLYYDLNILNSLCLAPFNRETHWKQTVLYLDDVLNGKKFDQVTGSIAVKKSNKNPRELDIKLSYHFNNERHSIDKSQYYRLCWVIRNRYDITLERLEILVHSFAK